MKRAACVSHILPLAAFVVVLACGFAASAPASPRTAISPRPGGILNPGAAELATAPQSHHFDSVEPSAESESTDAAPVCHGFRIETSAASNSRHVVSAPTLQIREPLSGSQCSRE